MIMMLKSENQSLSEAYWLMLRLYRALYRIRRVEEEIARVYPTDKIKSPVHLSIGQEGVAVGACEAPEPHDGGFGSDRGPAVDLPQGGDLRRTIAEAHRKGGSSG